LKQSKQVTTKVVCDIVPIRIGRVFKKTNCSVDSSDDVVNVFSLIFTDLECPNPGQDEFQSALRAVVQTPENKIKDQWTSATLHGSSLKLLHALVPKIGVHVALEKLELQHHAFTNEVILRPSVVPKGAKCDSFAIEQRVISEEIAGNILQISNGKAVNRKDNSCSIQTVISGQVLLDLSNMSKDFDQTIKEFSSIRRKRWDLDWVLEDLPNDLVIKSRLFIRRK